MNVEQLKDTTSGSDTRQSRPLHGPLMTFDLAPEIEQLRAEPSWASFGRSSKTLAKASGFRVVLSVVRAGVELGDQDARAPLAVQVLQGSVSAGRGGERALISTGGLAWLSEGAGWAVKAEEDAALLLSVNWPEERAEPSGRG